MGTSHKLTWVAATSISGAVETSRGLRWSVERGFEMSDEFDSLDAIEKAAVEAAVNRCRRLAAQIERKLHNKRPVHFVDKLSLADFHASLERAAIVLRQQKRQTQDTTEALPPMHSRRALPRSAHPAS
jgi:hypothetical protein